MTPAPVRRPLVADPLRLVDDGGDAPRLDEFKPSRRRLGEVGPAWRCDVPCQPTPLLGRVEERRIAASQLIDEGVRLLTLVGPGGVGKTHLAVALAEAIAPSFVNGARFVDLSTVADVETARALIEPALDSDLAADRDRAVQFERGSTAARTLLVLDNCEQLLPKLAQYISEVLTTDRAVVVLATSREPLHVRWEHRLPIRPLALPDRVDEATPDALLASPAVALFVARARAVRPDFELTPESGPSVAALCRRLDGLPLAIELAAARVDVLGPEAMLDRLNRQLPLPTCAAEDAPARHRTLESAVGWSYAQLQPSEQTLFRRLAVLSGAWTLDVAAVVGDTASLEMDGLTALVHLADKGLLQAAGVETGEIRFTMLETIRAIALELLESSGERDETRGRQAALSSHQDISDPSTAHQVSTVYQSPLESSARQVESPLSSRERDILRLVGEGLPSKQIGRELGLAERTVKAHVTGAMNKLGAFSRAQALGIAVERHYL